MSNRAFFTILKFTLSAYLLLWVILQGHAYFAQGNVKAPLRTLHKEVKQALLGVQILQNLGVKTPEEAMAKIEKNIRQAKSKAQTQVKAQAKAQAKAEKE